MVHKYQISLKLVVKIQYSVNIALSLPEVVIGELSSAGQKVVTTEPKNFTNSYNLSL